MQNMQSIENNLHLYIPRIGFGITEDQVKSTFLQNNIGRVEYCDFVLTKDKETGKPLHNSAFIKLSSWSSNSEASYNFAKHQSIKLTVDHNRSEFWIILPNKNPLPRTQVNTSQLAASTEKLFEQTEALDKKTDRFQDEMRAEMAEMRLFIKLQQEKIEHLENKLGQYEENSYDMTTSLIMANKDNENQIQRLNMEIFGEENSFYYDIKCSKEIKRQQQEAAEKKKQEEKDLAELNAAKMLAKFDSEIPIWQSMPHQMVRNKSHDDSDDDELYSIHYPKPQQLIRSPSVELATRGYTDQNIEMNSERMNASKYFCDNY